MSEAKDQNKQTAENLARVIEKNQQYLDTVAEDLLQACIGARTASEVPDAVIENVLKVYGSMRARLSEIEVVRALLLRRHNRTIPESPRRARLIAELDAQIKVLSDRVSKSSNAAESAPAHDARTPSGRWLRIEQDSLAFMVNARLLDELEYEPPAPAAGPSKRQVHASGRGFTLFSIRGPASALDDLSGRFALRQHDIVERFSATEIRGVLTHLRRTLTSDIKHIFERLMISRFPDVKCILVGLHTPDQMDDHFLKYLDRTVEDMKPGEIRTIEIADNG